MEKFNIECVEEAFGLSNLEPVERCMLIELAFVVISSNDECSGYTYEKRKEVREAMFGDLYGTAIESLTELAGELPNDLCFKFIRIANLDIAVSDFFSKLGKVLVGKEITQDICLKLLI